MRNLVLSFFIALLTFACAEPASDKKENNPIATADGIATGNLIDAGMDTGLIYRMEREISEGIFPNIHSVLIARNNKLVYEKYWPGKDEVWGIPVGEVPHGIDSLHDLRSISKSVVAICAGIAIGQGKIKSVDQKVFEFFPEYKKLDTGLISQLTVKHLLNMSSGLAWNEEVPYDNPLNSEIRMSSSPDPVQYVLSQPMDTVPGVVWKYNGGTTQLLAAIIEKTTGKKVDSFAAEYLFAPMGINRFAWARYPGTDMLAAASGVRLRPRDILKFGMMCYNKGIYNGKQIVPAQWIEDSFKPQVSRGKDGAYGYQFWIFNETVDNQQDQLVACVGNGDQRIFFKPDKDLLVVVTAGNYNKWDIPKNSHAMLYQYIYPAVSRK
jgi:CubicO group peptidase (beta-lactamase class C family)